MLDVVALDVAVPPVVPDVVELLVAPPDVSVVDVTFVELEVCEPDAVETSAAAVVVVGSTEVVLPEGEKHPLSTRAADVNVRGSIVDALTVAERCPTGHF